MLKTISTWVRSRALHEDLVAQQVEAASEQWDDVPLTSAGFPAPHDSGPLRRPTPPPLPPQARPSAARLLLPQAGAAPPIDPADVPTPPPLTTAPPVKIAGRRVDPADIPTPPPVKIKPGLQRRPITTSKA